MPNTGAQGNGITYGHGQPGEGGDHTQHHTHTPQGTAAKAKGLVAGVPLRPWIRINVSSKRAGYKNGVASPLRTQQQSMEGTMLRYQSRGEDAGGVYLGIYTNAGLIHYIV